jgi:hypothetical protein
MFIVASSTLAAKTGLPDFVIPDCLGVNIHFVGPEHKQIEQIADAGFRYIRMDYFWSDVEKIKGQYDFKPYDELLDALEKKNIRPIFILCYGNANYDDGKAPHTDAGRSAFVDYARAAAEHFKGRGILWEIWNEPNLSNFWQPNANVEDYVKLAKLVYPALKKADPSCTVLAPALAGWDFAFIEEAFKLGLLECTDVVSLHAYGASKPENAVDYYTTIRALIRKYAPKGKNVPIVSSEWGYSAVKGLTVEKQAEYLVRSFLINLMNDVRLSIWYDWRDDGPDPNEQEHNFGTVYLDLRPKPAYMAMQTLARELFGYAFAARIHSESGVDYLALFRKGDDYRLAAWTTGEPHKIKIPVDVEQFDVVSLTGERSRVEAQSGELELNLTGAVQYVEPLKPSKRWAIEAAWKVDAKAVWKDGRLEAQIVSEGINEEASITASGKGLGHVSQSAFGYSDKSLSRYFRYTYVWNGDSSPNVTVSLTIKGTDRPIVRVVQLDVSACPRIEFLPPTKDELAFAIMQPKSGERIAFDGKLMIGSTDGINPIELSKDVSLKPTEDKFVVRFKITQKPAPVFSFSSKLVDDAGAVIVRNPTKRYSIVETFADGRVGDEITKYKLELDGDHNVPARARLCYAKSPSGDVPSDMPGLDSLILTDFPQVISDICAKLDYEFDKGWRFVRISPRPMIPIHGRPLWAKLWVMGDKGNGLARLRLVDSDGQSFQPDYGRLSFSEWRCLTADMTCERAGHWGGKNDGVVRYPVSWDTIFLLDNMGGRKTKGTVYLGPLIVCYD